METLVIALIFIGALGFLGRMVYQQFWGKSAGQCAKGCGTCAALPTENK
ncbi:FeoB-associated Cys-rich membrane protein [Aquirufa sp. OSTEICH-129V]|jgi:hypothetical protein|uniref:FeoB-associated Cys-rich membrane protein n=1 Tax=Aquirufa avitistagni TaxID=3104728 RepID=A0ABW6DEL2_9BACT